MTWLRLDDQFHRHRKVAPLSDAAFRLHVTVMLECSNQLTDGRIDCVLVPTLPRVPSSKAGLRKVTDELERAGLWHRDGDAWVVHDFLDWNPTAADVKHKREVRAKAGQKGGKRSGESRARGKPLLPDDEAHSKQLLQQTRSKPEPKTNPVPVPVPVPVPRDSKAATSDPRPSGCSDPPPPPLRQRQHVPKPEPVPSQPIDEPEAPALESSVFDVWRPRNRQEALDAPIQQRAEWATREQWAAAEYAPQLWPEVQVVAQAFHAAYKLAPPKLSRLDQDRATQRIVAALAQYTPAQLVLVCKALPASKWSLDMVANGKRPALSWLTPEVVRTQFSDLPSERPVSERVRKLTAHLAPMREEVG